jgi:hypothetical protein
MLAEANAIELNRPDGMKFATQCRIHIGAAAGRHVPPMDRDMIAAGKRDLPGRPVGMARLAVMHHQPMTGKAEADATVPLEYGFPVAPKICSDHRCQL